MSYELGQIRQPGRKGRGRVTAAGRAAAESARLQGRTLTFTEAMKLVPGHKPSLATRVLRKLPVKAIVIGGSLLVGAGAAAAAARAYLPAIASKAQALAKGKARTPGFGTGPTSPEQAMYDMLAKQAAGKTSFEIPDIFGPSTTTPSPGAASNGATTEMPGGGAPGMSLESPGSFATETAPTEAGMGINPAFLVAGALALMAMVGGGRRR